MKKTISIALMLLITQISFAQDFDNLMTKRQIDCSDIAYNSSLYFIKYVEESKIDSAKSLLKYWETKCGMREPLHRARILLAIKQGEFNDSLISDGTLNNMFNYQSRMQMIKYADYYSYDNYKSYYGFIPPGQEFDSYTQNLAKSLTKQYNPETIEYLVAEFYAENSDTIFSKIQSEAYAQSKLKKEYEKMVQTYVNMTEFHFAVITGAWIPTGDLKQVGNHPEFGIQLGTKNKKMNYDLTMAFRFVDSPNEYYARRNKTALLEPTKLFFGGYFGIDVGRDIYTKKGNEIQLIGGVGYDGFDVFNVDKDNNLKSATTSSYNFNFGVGYRYYITNTFYLGLKAKYNLVDYTLNNTIDFTGNPVTIQFIIGSVDNLFRNKNLKELKYKQRK